jgi:uncharacterized protein
MHGVLAGVLGAVAGILSGIMGIGGGIILIPALVYLFGFSQHDAQGTTLAAMVPPIGLLAAFRYWQSGHVHFPTACFIALGFFLGGYLGAHLIQETPDIYLKRFFGVFLFIVSMMMIFGK